MTAPLSDIRVITVSEYGAGPIATELLADLGADVVKIESPKLGDSSRYVPPYQEGDDSLFFQSCNRGKRSIAVDLKEPAGQDILRRLAAGVDAVFTNIRPSAARRLGLTYDALKDVNPAIVAFLLSGWGRRSDRADRPTYDYAVQAFGGQMDLNAEAGEAPRRSATPWVDTSTSFVAAFGLLAAVHQARRTGVGGDAEASMVDVAMAQWMYLSTWYLTRGHVPDRFERSAHPSVVPSQLFEVRDGYVMIMCQTQQFWHRLCTAFGRDDLAADPRFADMAARREHKAELITLLDAEFRERTRAEVAELLDGRVPMEVVQTFTEGMEAYREHHPEGIITVDHPVFGPVSMVGTPVRSDAWAVTARRAPRWGEHTRDVLEEAGLDQELIRSLEHRGVIRCE